MHPYSRFFVAAALSVLVPLVACSGDKKKEGGSAAADKPAEGTGDTAGPQTMTAPALFDDFNKPGQDGMALYQTYNAGIVVSGTVTNTITEMDNAVSVWLDAGNGHHVSLGFKDNGAAAAKKGVKAGDALSASCQVGGSDGKTMMLTDCALK